MLGRRLIAACVLGLVSGSALAGEDSFRWTAPPPEVQVLMDRTVVPSNQGALFVPSISGAEREPKVILVDGGAVLEIPVGQRVALDPGDYVVLVGSADPAIAAGVPVRVIAGQTAVVPVRWGALRVEVVDRDLIRHDGPYELVHVATGQVVELPERLQTDAGVSTYLLAPGLYRVTEPGAKKLDDPDFMTVYVPASAEVNLRVFMDRRSGTLRGGGVIPQDEVSEPELEEESMWSSSIVLGLEGNATQAEHVVGVQDVTQLQGGAFLNARAAFRSDHHGLVLKGTIEESFSNISWAGGSLPWYKANDRLDAQASYTFFLNEGVGLYARGAGETQLLDTFAIAPVDMELAIREASGEVVYRSVGANERYKIADAFSPLVLRAGAGLQSSLFAMKNFDVSLRAGPAWRSYRYAGALASTDNPGTPAFEYDRIGSFDLRGAEAVASVSGRVRGWVAVQSELDAFFPLSDLGSPILSWDNSVGLHLTDVFSLNYVLTVDRVPMVNEQLQIRQSAMLRASWSLL